MMLDVGAIFVQMGLAKMGSTVFTHRVLFAPHPHHRETFQGVF